MVQILGIDLGIARSGIAFADTKNGFIVALDTYEHHTDEQLMQHLQNVVKVRKIERTILGLPLLLSGKEGKQALRSQNFAKEIEKNLQIPVTLIDERYTTIPSYKSEKTDNDARAACQIVQMYMEQNC